jgi:hypothetical protein
MQKTLEWRKKPNMRKKKKIKKITKAILKKREKKRLAIEDKQKHVEWRRKVFERDNYTDQISGKQTEGRLDPHHILDKKHFPQFRFEVMNGITLNYWNHKVGNLCPHLNAIYFSEWLKVHKPEQWHWVRARLVEMKLLNTLDI